MAARTSENPPEIGAAAPQHPSPEAASEREPAEPTAANRAIDAGPDPAAGARLPGQLQNLAETGRDYAKASSAENTRKAYASDWRHYTGWARRHGLAALPPDPQILGLYVAACASGAIRPVRLRGTENRHKDFTNPLTPRGTDRWLRDGR